MANRKERSQSFERTPKAQCLEEILRPEFDEKVRLHGKNLNTRLAIYSKTWEAASPLHSSTRYLLGEIIFLVVTASALGFLGYPMFLPYSWHLFLHILGVVLFLGNIVVTAVWMILSERTKEPKVLEFSSRAVNWADVGFTAPGIILIVLNGVTLAVRWNGPLGTGWLMAAGALFLGSGIVWVGFLIRYQNKMIRLSSSPERLEGGGGGGELPSEFFRVLHKWYFWGAVATILPIAASIFMVVKPPI